jgi:hypothetical protein
MDGGKESFRDFEVGKVTGTLENQETAVRHSGDPAAGSIERQDVARSVNHEHRGLERAERGTPVPFAQRRHGEPVHTLHLVP